MIETWLPIAGFDSYYQVSDQGRVRSLDRIVQCSDGRLWFKSGRVLSPGNRDEYGHLNVVLSIGGGHTTKQVHNLVLSAFIGPCPVGLECRHLNGNASDNRLVNLAWGTRLQNTQDLLKHGRHHYAKRTHCSAGHQFSVDNTMIRRDGGRRCRQCKSERSRRGFKR